MIVDALDLRSSGSAFVAALAREAGTTIALPHDGADDVSSSSRAQKAAMTREEALEAHVRANEQEFRQIGHAFDDMRAFVTGQIAKVDDRIDRLQADLRARFDTIDRRFDAMDRRFERLDGQIELLVRGLLKGPQS